MPQNLKHRHRLNVTRYHFVHYFNIFGYYHNLFLLISECFLRVCSSTNETRVFVLQQNLIISLWRPTLTNNEIAQRKINQTLFILRVLLQAKLRASNNSKFKTQDNNSKSSPKLNRTAYKERGILALYTYMYIADSNPVKTCSPNWYALGFH